MAGLFALPLVAEGRGNDPSGGSGVAIIVGIVVAVAVLGFAAHFLLHRFGRTTRRSQEAHPDTAGRVGRVSKLQDD